MAKEEKDIYANEAEYKKLQEEDPIEFDKRLWAMRSIYQKIFGDLPPCYLGTEATGLCEIEHAIETETEIKTEDIPGLIYE